MLKKSSISFEKNDKLWEKFIKENNISHDVDPDTYIQMLLLSFNLLLIMNGNTNIDEE